MTETLNRESLNPKDKDLLEKTLAKSPSEMTEEDKGVIRARRSYLTALELDVFSEVLRGKNVEVAVEEVVAPAAVVEETPKKTKRRKK